MRCALAGIAERRTSSVSTSAHVCCLVILIVRFSVLVVSFPGKQFAGRHEYIYHLLYCNCFSLSPMTYNSLLCHVRNNWASVVQLTGLGFDLISTRSRRGANCLNLMAATYALYTSLF